MSVKKAAATARVKTGSRLGLLPKTQFNKTVAAVLAGVLIVAGIYLVFASEASPVVMGGTAYGPYPAAVPSAYPSAANIYFGSKLTGVSKICFGLDMNHLNGGEGLGYGERGTLTVVGGGAGTKFGNETPNSFQMYGSVCTTDKADLAHFLDGAHQVRLRMDPGSTMTVTRMSVHAFRGEQ
jgi:hypothetical protein